MNPLEPQNPKPLEPCLPGASVRVETLTLGACEAMPACALSRNPRNNASPVTPSIRGFWVAGMSSKQVTEGFGLQGSTVTISGSRSRWRGKAP